MQVKKTDISDTQIKITVNPTAAELESLKDHVLRHFIKRGVKIPGFREGKAPLNLIEKHIDPNQLQTEFLEEAINNYYAKVVQSEGLRPVNNPQVTVKKFIPYTELEFEAEMEVIGEIKLGDYKKVKKTKKPVEVTAKDIDNVLNALKKRLADKKETDRASKESDEVVIDFKGVDSKGTPVNGAEGKDYPLVLGSNTFIPGFEPNLVGLKAGEEKTFTITFPKDYGVAALQNKKVVFTVKVHKVNEVIEPKADDGFAAKAGPFKTLAELKADIKKQLTYEHQQEADRAYENELLQAIAEKSSVKIPETLINDQISRAENEERQNLAYRGQTWEEHLAEEGVTEEEHRQRNHPTAEQSVKMGLVLTEIAEKEGVNVTTEELDIRMQILKAQYQDPAMQAELDKPEARRDVASRLMTEKTIAKLTEYAAK